MKLAAIVLAIPIVVGSMPEFQREVQHPRPKHFNEFGFDRDGRDRQIFMKS